MAPLRQLMRGSCPRWSTADDDYIKGFSLAHIACPFFDLAKGNARKNYRRKILLRATYWTAGFSCAGTHQTPQSEGADHHAGYKQRNAKAAVPQRAFTYAGQKVSH